MKYLQDKSFYEDRYDLHTIEECLKWFNDLKSGMEQHRAEFKPEPPHHTDFDHEVLKVCSYTVNTMAINRFRYRKEKVDEWISKEKEKQEFFDSAIPTDPSCDKCKSLMQVIDKNLHDYLDKPMKVSFMYECTSCKFRKLIYSDGSPWDYEEPKCPECKSKLKNEYKDNKKKLTTTTTCTKCSYKKVDIINFEKNRLERVNEEQRRANLFKQWRSVFCFDDIEGPKAVANLDGIVRLAKEWKEEDKKKANPIYQKARALKTLKIYQLKLELLKVIEPFGYDDLKFMAPEMGRNVIVEFTASDTNDERGEYDAKNVLKKTIVSLLEGTNWRLMSDGISYRLGILSGKLKAYELEEDLMNLVK